MIITQFLRPWHTLHRLWRLLPQAVVSKSNDRYTQGHYSMAMLKSLYIYRQKFDILFEKIVHVLAGIVEEC